MISWCLIGFMFSIMSPIELYKDNCIPDIIHLWYNTEDPRQLYVQYAYKLWGIDFVTLIECENGRRDPNRISKTQDYGLCQLHYSYNKKFINSEDFKDPYKQLDYCYEKYKINPKLWYGPNRKIKGQKCSSYVLDRFKIKNGY
jgi:hypothetical protein